MITPEEVALHVQTGPGALIVADGVLRTRSGALGFVPDHLIGDDPDAVKAGLRAAYGRAASTSWPSTCCCSRTASRCPPAAGPRWPRSPPGERRPARSAATGSIGPQAMTSAASPRARSSDQRAGGGQVLGEGVDVGERRRGVLDRGGEDQRVRGVADALLLAVQQLGGAEVAERLDDAAVSLRAIAVHGHLIARLRATLTRPVRLLTRGGRVGADDHDRPGRDRAHRPRRARPRDGGAARRDPGRLGRGRRRRRARRPRRAAGLGADRARRARRDPQGRRPPPARARRRARRAADPGGRQAAGRLARRRGGRDRRDRAVRRARALCTAAARCRAAGTRRT